MSKIVFLDSSVFIRGYNRPNSNSGKILKLMDGDKIRVIISEKVIEELRRYFITHYSKDVWSASLQLWKLFLRRKLQMG